MTVLEGGVVDRLILKSARHMIHDCLTALDWFEPGRYHEPITWLNEGPMPPWASLQDNTILVWLDDMDDEEAELGSTATIDDHHLIVDVVAKTSELAKHVAGDCRDILRGKMPSIGRDRPILEVLDYGLATPTRVFVADVENVRSEPGSPPLDAHLQHWRSVMCSLIVEPF